MFQNQSRLLNAMGTLTPEQRCYIGMKYKELFDTDLRDLMKSECGKKAFGLGLQMLALPPNEMEVSFLKRAAKGIGTDERLVHSIICGRSNKDMEILKKTFFRCYTKDLGGFMDSELGGNMEALIINCLQAAEEAYDPDYHTEDKMAEDVDALYEMAQG